MNRPVDNVDADILRVLRAVEEVEQLIEAGTGVFGQRLINEEQFFDRMIRLRRALPKCLEEAQELLRRKEQILSEGQSTAQRIRAFAHQEAHCLQDDATQQAARMVEEAQSRREQLLADAAHEAERLVAEAGQQAEQLVAEYPLTRRAEQTAAEVRQVAQQDAREMRTGAQDYAMEIMDRLQRVVVRLHERVEKDKAQIGPVPVAGEASKP